jgi:hypothetical protein
MKTLGKIGVQQKTGEESLSYDGLENGIRLIDFWRWSTSDLISNATRGRFAEFIVASALNVDFSIIRDEWGPYDLDSPDGIKVEVKSASYLQTWYQKDYSPISFSIKEAKHWDSAPGIQSKTTTRHADIYVFCLLKHKDQPTLDPMSLEQWEFYVIPTVTLDNYTRSKSSITLNSLKKLTTEVQYPELKQSIVNNYKSSFS